MLGGDKTSSQTLILLAPRTNRHGPSSSQVGRKVFVDVSWTEEDALSHLVDERIGSGSGEGCHNTASLDSSWLLTPKVSQVMTD